MSDSKRSFVPNSFQTPNGYVDDLMKYLTGEEYKVLIYATRRILGFQKRQDRISLSQFTDGTKAKDGRILDSGTGVSKETVKNCLDNLVKFGLMVREAENDPRTNEGTLWSLQWDEGLVNWDAIRECAEKRSKINASRIQKARSVRQTAVSGTDRARDCGTDLGGDCGTGTQNTGFKSSSNTEEEDLRNLFLRASQAIFDGVKNLSALRTVTAELESSNYSLLDRTIIVSGLPGDRPEYYRSRYKTSFEKLFIGFLGSEVSIEFTGSGDAQN